MTSKAVAHIGMRAGHHRVGDFAKKFGITRHCAYKMLKKAPHIADLDEMTIRVLINLRKRGH